MKIGISRPSRTTEEGLEVFAAARRYGFDGVQVKPHQYDPCNRSPEAFREAFGEYADLARGGIVVYPGGDFEAWPDVLEAVIPFAAGIGAEEICICAPVDRFDSSVQRFKAVAETLHAVGRQARERGVGISLHNHADCLFETEDDLAALLQHLDPALCGLTLDTAHAAKGGITDVGGAATRFKEHLTNVHLKDLSPEGKFCPLGRGTLDLPGVLEALARIGYDRWLVVDEESDGFTTDEAYRISMDFLKRQGLAR
jgi:inosose dehydratase